VNYNIGRHDVTKSTPRVSTGAVAEDSVVGAELAAWLSAVEHAARRRVTLERLIRARGIVRPITLAQRFYLKSREIGVVATVRLVRARLRQMRSGGA
jgi:hypothetical protein